MPASISCATFVLGVMSRSLIVRHADGFVHRGQLILTLLHQLYWLGWVVKNVFVFTIFPITPLLAEGHLKKTESVKTCMFTPFEVEEVDKNQRTSQLVYFFGAFLELIIIFFWVHRVQRFKACYFPNGRMAAIGFYKRNLISFSISTKLAIYFLLLMLTPPCFLAQTPHHRAFSCFFSMSPNVATFTLQSSHFVLLMSDDPG